MVEDSNPNRKTTLCMGASTMCTSHLALQRSATSICGSAISPWCPYVLFVMARMKRGTPPTAGGFSSPYLLLPRAHKSTIL